MPFTDGQLRNLIDRGIVPAVPEGASVMRALALEVLQEREGNRIGAGRTGAWQGQCEKTQSLLDDAVSDRDRDAYRARVVELGAQLGNVTNNRDAECARLRVQIQTANVVRAELEKQLAEKSDDARTQGSANLQDLLKAAEARATAAEKATEIVSKSRNESNSRVEQLTALLGRTQLILQGGRDARYLLDRLHSDIDNALNGAEARS